MNFLILREKQTLDFLSKSVQKLNNFKLINKAFTKIADKGIFS